MQILTSVQRFFFKYRRETRTPLRLVQPLIPVFHPTAAFSDFPSAVTRITRRLSRKIPRRKSRRFMRDQRGRHRVPSVPRNNLEKVPADEPARDLFRWRQSRHCKRECVSNVQDGAERKRIAAKRKKLTRCSRTRSVKY